MLCLRPPGFEFRILCLAVSDSSHHPQEVLLAHFSLYVHKSGPKPDSFHFLDRDVYMALTLTPCCPTRVGCLLLELWIYGLFKGIGCAVLSMVLCIINNPSSLSIRVGHSPDFGLPPAAILIVQKAT